MTTLKIEHLTRGLRDFYRAWIKHEGRNTGNCFIINFDKMVIDCPTYYSIRDLEALERWLNKDGWHIHHFNFERSWVWDCH